MPPSIESIILRLLAKDPKQRFSSAAETRTALIEALANRHESNTIEAAANVAYLREMLKGNADATRASARSNSSDPLAAALNRQD